MVGNGGDFEESGVCRGSDVVMESGDFVVVFDGWGLVGGRVDEKAMVTS